MSNRERVITISVAIFLGGVLLGSLILSQADAQKLQPGDLPLPQTNTNRQQLQATGTITGRVTNSAGMPLAGIQVVVYEATAYRRIGQGITASDGGYVIGGVKAHYGKVKVRFNHQRPNAPLDDRYVTQWYPNGSYFSQADIIPLTDGGTLTDVNASLEQGGAISGSVTFAGDNRVAAGVPVDIFTPDGGYLLQTNTDSQGQFLAKGLRPGQVVLKFGSPGMASIAGGEVWYQNQPDLPKADRVTVLNETMTELQVSLPVAGYITGLVTAEDTGNPIRSVLIRVLDRYGKQIRLAVTNQQGEYAVGTLGTGQYKAQFSQAGYLTEYYDDQTSLRDAMLIGVTGGLTTTNIDAALSPNLSVTPTPTPAPDTSLGTITGTVTTDGGQPLDLLDEIYVMLFDEADAIKYTTYLYRRDTYTLSRVLPGTYRLYADGKHTQDAWYSEAGVGGPASPISVTANVTSRADVDLVSHSGCLVSSVQAPDNVMLGGIFVRIQEADTIGLNYSFGSAMVSDGSNSSCAAGSFLEGNYLVSYVGYPYIPEWHDDVYYGIGDKTQAIPVTVSSAMTTSIETRLELGACISGQVIDARTGLREPFTKIRTRQANGVDEVLIYGVDSQDISLPRSVSKISGGGIQYSTDAGGEFAVCGLPGGDFILQPYQNERTGSERLVSVTAGQEITGVTLIYPVTTYLPIILKE